MESPKVRRTNLRVVMFGSIAKRWPSLNRQRPRAPNPQPDEQAVRHKPDRRAPELRHDGAGRIDLRKRRPGVRVRRSLDALQYDAFQVNCDEVDRAGVVD